MVQRTIFLIVVLFPLVSCSNQNSGILNGDNSGIKTVTIRGKNNSTIYKVNPRNQVEKSSFTNENQVTTTRNYSYNEEDELVLIEKTNSRSGTDYVHISTEKDRNANNQVRKKVKTLSNNRGEGETFTVSYYYDEDGKMIGMLQEDAYGNLTSKGVRE